MRELKINKFQGDNITLTPLKMKNKMIQQQINLCELEQKRKKLLDSYAKKQSFRVAIGKSTWLEYKEFNPAYNLREILNDEIVIEFDSENKNLTWEAINFTAINLYNAGYSFEIWNHEGKSPHLHIHNLPISNLDKDKLKLFKKLFIRKYVPLEYLPYVDTSLTGVHLIALEWANHWKGKYSIKKLLNKWGSQNEMIKGIKLGAGGLGEKNTPIKNDSGKITHYPTSNKKDTASFILENEPEDNQDIDFSEFDKEFENEM